MGFDVESDNAVYIEILIAIFYLPNVSDSQEKVDNRSRSIWFTTSDKYFDFLEIACILAV
jgi:hypothetical protein